MITCVGKPPLRNCSNGRAHTNHVIGQRIIEHLHSLPDSVDLDIEDTSSPVDLFLSHPGIDNGICPDLMTYKTAVSSYPLTSEERQPAPYCLCDCRRTYPLQHTNGFRTVTKVLVLDELLCAAFVLLYWMT